MRRKKVKGVFKYLVLFSLTVFAVWYWQTRMVELPVRVEVPAPVVTVIRAERGGLERELSFRGYVEAESMVTVLPLVGGRLDELSVQEGQRVTDGQIVASIDRTSYQLQLNQAASAFASARSSFERISRLYEQGAVTQQTYDQTKAQYDAMQSQYELAQLQLDHTEVKAPVSGTVLIRHLSAGNLASVQSPIITIADLSRLQVRINVPQEYYDLFSSRYDSIPIRMRRTDDDQRAITGRIIRVSQYIDAESKRFEVLCKIDEPEYLRPGMSVVVSSIIERYTDQYLLPYQVQSSQNTLWYVDPADSTAHQLVIVPEAESDELFSVPSEYRDLLFIIEGQHFLREGQQVSVGQGDGP
ncbi:MAG: efflux RND transporter periplasmic adaptor subunit [Spirochaetia bacterium]|nr:efflux RND transporter periplasmic adaptor subunit [Spirochaetia bacterium]